MKTITFCLIAVFFVAGTTHTSAQIRLGAVSSTRLNTSAGIHTAGVSNALRAATNSGIGVAGQAKTTATSTTRATSRTAARTTKRTTASVAEAAPAVTATGSAGATAQAPDANVHANADVQAKNR